MQSTMKSLISDGDAWAVDFDMTADLFLPQKKKLIRRTRQARLHHPSEPGIAILKFELPATYILTDPSVPAP